METTSFKIAAWAIVAAIVATNFGPLLLPPELLISAKTGRGIAFVFATVALLEAYPKNRTAALIGICMLAGLTEIPLLLLPGKPPQLFDMIDKLGGISLGSVISLWLSKGRASRHVRAFAAGNRRTGVTSRSFSVSTD